MHERYNINSQQKVRINMFKSRTCIDGQTVHDLHTDNSCVVKKGTHSLLLLCFSDQLFLGLNWRRGYLDSEPKTLLVVESLSEFHIFCKSSHCTSKFTMWFIRKKRNGKMPCYKHNITEYALSYTVRIIRRIALISSFSHKKNL